MKHGIPGASKEVRDAFVLSTVGKPQNLTNLLKKAIR